MTMQLERELEDLGPVGDKDIVKQLVELITINQTLIAVLAEKIGMTSKEFNNICDIVTKQVTEKYNDINLKGILEK